MRYSSLMRIGNGYPTPPGQRGSSTHDIAAGHRLVTKTSLPWLQITPVPLLILMLKVTPHSLVHCLSGIQRNLPPPTPVHDLHRTCRSRCLVLCPLSISLKHCRHLATTIEPCSRYRSGRRPRAAETTATAFSRVRSAINMPFLSLITFHII